MMRPIYPTFTSRSTTWVLVVAALLLSSGLTTATRAWETATDRHDSISVTVPAPPAPASVKPSLASAPAPEAIAAACSAAATEQEVEVEAITAMPQGFAPSESHVRAAHLSLTHPHADRPRAETEVVTLKPFGFEPGEITRPQGRFILKVNNRSGLEEMHVRLQREAGQSEREAKVHRKRLDWSDELNLPPGRYVLRVADHPQWACRITITSH